MEFFKKIVFIVICLFITVAWSSPKPKIFLIGDSISIHYGPYLKQYLDNFAVFERKTGDNGQPSNGGDSRMVLEYLRAKLKEPAFKPDYILLNCGLHDIKHNPDASDIQVTEDHYRKNLIEIVQMLQKEKIKLIWIRTTWVVDSIHNTRVQSGGVKRYESDVLKYNAIADEICHKYKIPSIDLHDFSKKLGAEHFSDHVHYDEMAQSLQAAYIVGFLQNEINKIICE